MHLPTAVEDNPHVANATPISAIVIDPDDDTDTTCSNVFNGLLTENPSSQHLDEDTNSDTEVACSCFSNT